jgi:hypothetical protein
MSTPPHEPNLDMIQFTYKEVLDATKHQDDKIGRVITAVSFLTAASLALAGLASAGLLSRNFDVAPLTVPIAVIALGLFLVGVVFTVVVLVAGLGTPLRLPGLARSSTAPVRWASHEAQASPLYFAEISKLTLAEWTLKWRADTDALKSEQFDSLIGETHNLAVRTNFKYDRFREAIAIFSLAFVSLAAAIVLVFTAATQPTDAHPPATVHLYAASRTALGLVFAFYCLIQIFVRFRYDRQTVDEAVGLQEKGEISRRAWLERGFALSTATIVLLILLPLRVGSQMAWILPIAILGVISIWCHWLAAKAAARKIRLAVAMIIVAITALACVGIGRQEYLYQLIAAYVAVIALIIPSFVGPTLTSALYRRKYLDRHPELS